MKHSFNCLFLGDYNASTGYGTVSKNLVPAFKRDFFKKYFDDRWNLDICAVNFFGPIKKEDDHTTVFSALYSTKIISEPDTRDDFGRHGFLKVLTEAAAPPLPGENITVKECGYDGIFIIQDVPVINVLVPLMEDLKRRFREENKKQFKSIIYFPADHPLIFPFVRDLEFFDAIVTYNEYAKANILRLKPSLEGRVKVIPHGTNTRDFYPIIDKDKVARFRQEYFEDNAEKFIVTNINRNQPRKDIPCTILGFEEYKKNYNPDAFLYLHMNPNDPLGHDLRAVLMQTSLQEGIDFMLPDKGRQNHGFSTEDLNLIYNASDVFLTTTLGEGWGLTVTEAMACRLPVICPMHTSFLEITDHGKRAYALENLYPICNVTDNAIRLQCDYLEVAAMLDTVYHDIKNSSETLAEKTKAALQYVQSHTWENVSKQWIELLKKVYS